MVGGRIRVVCIWQKIHNTGIWPLTAMSQLSSTKRNTKAHDGFMEQIPEGFR
jgi:hypothetical protein